MKSGPADPATLERIKTIFRRDLKLGPDISIADDMPFFGGDVDLDSLDMLLLVTSIEKEFGIKIANESVGRAVFENIDTLARFITAEQAKGHTALIKPAAMAHRVSSPLDRLPHADPFRFVTKLIRLEEGKSGEGVWSISGAEAFFMGHFPGKPIVPGVLIAEALAQLSGIVGEVIGEPRAHEGMLVHVDVRFEQPVAPPADLILQSTLTRSMGDLQQFDVVASLGGASVARGSITLHRPKV